MTAKAIDNYHLLTSCPATEALKMVQATKILQKRRTPAFDVSLTTSLFDLTFADAAETFPTIEWDSDDDFDSVSSLRSLDTFTSLISDDSSMSSLGKRTRSDSHSRRRLVRSRKIKSSLDSLAMPMPMPIPMTS